MSSLRAVILTGCLSVLAALSAGCEVLVQLDRGVVDAGGDAGCPLCSDAGADGNDGPADGDAFHADAHATREDADATRPVADAGAEKG